MILFVISFLFSFIGSIPLGSLNLNALQILKKDGVYSLIFFCIACSIVEFFYSAIAIFFETEISYHANLKVYFQIITILVFLSLAYLNLFVQVKQKEFSKNKNSITQNFGKGIFLSIINPQAIPFWILISHLIKTEFKLVIQSQIEILFFSTGVSLGSFICLVFFAMGINKILDKKKLTLNLNKIIGIIFLGLGVFQLVRYCIQISS